MSRNNRLGRNSSNSNHGQSSIQEFRRTFLVKGSLIFWCECSQTKVCFVVDDDV